MLQSNSEFERFFALGYTRLIPIIPPDADISEGSSLHKRVGTHQDGRGKTPGVRGYNGRWYGFDWIPHEADAHDLSRWAAMGAGVGVKTGRGLVAIDADTLREDFAEIIRDAVDLFFGATPIRVGRYPKALYLVQIATDAEMPYMRVDFGPRDDRGIAERCEVLYDGRQFVAHGTHPKTHRPYSWPRPPVPVSDLPETTPDELRAFLEHLRQHLPDAPDIVSEGSGAEVDQDSLRGDPALVRRAVEAAPNTSAHFPSRESYLGFGYAIKAALPDDEHEAFELFSDWCARWHDGDNDPDIVAADWARMKPPFKRGARFVYDTAAEASGGAFSAAEAHFSPVVHKDPSPFDVQHQHEAEALASDTFALLTVDDIVSRPPPTFLLDRHIPDVSVGFLYSAPGVGKSFLAMDIGLSLAHGLSDWHGDALHPPEDPVTLYIASEGSFDLSNRIRAWHQHRGIAQLTQRFLVIEQTIDFMRAEDVEKLVRTVRAAQIRPTLVVVDTVSRAMPGADENLQKDMTLFVRACDRVRDEFQCAVMGVHHAGKNGDMRGSTVLLGAGDFVMRLDRPKGASVGKLTMEKQKAAEDGWDYPVLFPKVEIEGGGSSLVISRDVGPGAAGQTVTITADTTRAALRALDAAWQDGKPWSSAPQAKERYAVRRLVADFGWEGTAAEDAVRTWLATGLIEKRTRNSSTKTSGYQVTAAGRAAFLGDGPVSEVTPFVMENPFG